jgi:hypothetical protein
MRGGARTGAGRKPKADELKLIENLTPLHKQALESLKIGLEANDFKYVKLFFQYFYGCPKQMLHIEPAIEPNFPEWMTEATDDELSTISDIIDKNIK